MSGAVETELEWSEAAAREDRLEVGEFCPRQPYLEVRVPSVAKSVRRLAITTVSHDQGFSDTAERDGGTYHGSTSWFEVVVVTPEYLERSPSRRFQYNVNASLEPRRHLNVWDVESDDAARREWLAYIRPGDIVQVVPRADFALWVNYVYEVKVEMTGDRIEAPENSSGSDICFSSTGLYDGLDALKRQIRIISLHPGTPGEPLSCHIQTISLLDPEHEPYEALSYCWGEPDMLECIQDDLEERAQQVAQMQFVYSQASRVVIWLGPLNAIRQECFDKVMAIEARLLQQYDPSRSYERQDMDQMEMDAVDAELHWVGADLGFTIRWRECDFDWFRRIWVLQEVANAQTAVVCCGNRTVSWAALSAFARCTVRQKRASPLIQYGIMPSPFLQLARYLDHDSPAPWQTSSDTREGILDMLIKAHCLKATDPRDKLFALLQFGRETSDATRLPAALLPDYRKPVHRVFTDFVRWWICEHRSLRILSAVHTLQGRSWQKMYHGTPTDLRDLPYPTWFLWYGGEANWTKATLGLAADTPYRASGSSTPDFELVQGPDALSRPGVLRLGGHRLCVVSDIAAFPFWAAWMRRDNPPQPELYEAFIRIFNPTSNCRTWLLDREDQEIEQPEEAKEHHRYERHFTYHQRGSGRGSPAIPCYSPCLFTADGPSAAGQHLGLCPHNARPSDIVVVLHGGPVPYLLREQSEGGDTARGEATGTFEFVGECLLGGYMQGKAMDQALERGLQAEYFDLV